MSISEITIESLACGLREEAGIDPLTPLEDIDSFVAFLGYDYLAENFGHEFSAFCRMLTPGRFVIIFNSDQFFNDRFRRFSIAHELGHLTIPAHRKLLESGRLDKSRSEFRSKKPLEREADVFAARLLAPTRATAQLARSLDFVDSSIETIARHFDISLLSAAIRFVEVTDLVCSLIVSRADGKVLFERRSRGLWNELKHSFISGQTVSERTVTHEFVRAIVNEHEGDVHFSDWYPEITSDTPAREIVMSAGYGDRYITLLTPHEIEFH